jgi:hypothetical protein
METSHTDNRAFVVLRRAGAQPQFDIAAIARELARSQTSDAALHILFDWSQIDTWPFEAPSAAAIRAWHATAPLIGRAAFIHDPKWNRHVAMVSALMRISNAEVRSFHPPDADRALEWLEKEPQKMSSR